jgi:hypothetical protein
MLWHASKSDPRKVYDSRHETVCVCQNADQAALIVRAVNALPDEARGSFVKLREPMVQKSEFTHATTAEGCCARSIAKASLSGALDSLQPFHCAKCGTEYRAKRVGPVVNWEGQCDVVVFKP